ncbi:MAG: phoC [Phenylobacterium sp.]|nr:phoC [Phenylobacterium sp.]
MIKSLFLGAGLAAAIAAGAGAARPVLAPAQIETVAAAPPKVTGYLPNNDIDGEAVIGPPPAVESIAGQADRAAYLETRKAAGSARWALAIKDNDLWNGGALERYSCALGRVIGPQATPVTYRILRRVEIDVRTVGTPPKEHYNRTRPPIGDDRPICVPREDWMKTNASYPSGHAMTGWAWGLILGELAPARLGKLMEAGGAIGDSRVICGVHYRSDVEAGRKLGASLVARLHADPAFQKDLAAARAELKHGRATAPLSCAA